MVMSSPYGWWGIAVLFLNCFRFVYKLITQVLGVQVRNRILITLADSCESYFRANAFFSKRERNDQTSEGTYCKSIGGPITRFCVYLELLDRTTWFSQRRWNIPLKIEVLWELFDSTCSMPRSSYMGIVFGFYIFHIIYFSQTNKLMQL